MWSLGTDWTGRLAFGSGMHVVANKKNIPLMRTKICLSCSFVYCNPSYNEREVTIKGGCSGIYGICMNEHVNYICLRLLCYVAGPQAGLWTDLVFSLLCWSWPLTVKRTVFSRTHQLLRTIIIINVWWTEGHWNRLSARASVFSCQYSTNATYSFIYHWH
jgi:hypothetical protein